METFIHIYFPSSITKILKHSNSITRSNTNPINVFGIRRTIRNSTTQTNPAKSDVTIHSVSITSLHTSDYSLHPEEEDESKIGEILFHDGAPKTYKLTSSSPIWIQLKPNSADNNDIQVYTVYDTNDNTLIPKSHVLVFNYNPQELQYACGKEYFNVPQLILDSYNLHNGNSYMGAGLRLLPKLSPIINEIDNENESDCGKSMESESETENTMWAHISKRSCGIQQISHKLTTLSKVSYWQSKNYGSYFLHPETF